MNKISDKSSKILVLGPICPNLDFKYCKMSMLDFHSIPFEFRECKFSSKSGKVLNLVPIYLKIDFRCNIVKYQC